MKNSVIRQLLLAIALSTIGCGTRFEGDVMDIASNTPDVQRTSKNDLSESAPSHENTSMPHDHKQAFAYPEEVSKKWNNPERDKWQHPEEIIAALALKPGATVADLGAGTGYMVAHMSKAVGQDGTVMAIDASEEMVEYLTKRQAELGPATIVPQKVGFDDPELPASGVDRVLTLDTWHHIEGRETYAKKVYDGLKRGGLFVVVEHDVQAEHGPPKGMRLDSRQTARQLEAAGFRAEIVLESMPRHYMVVGHKD
ncbi:class I SAM-dependent methyltransferase [Planctopirus hydrillae]|uniref:Methyltransferase type 11 n=1 Tax=Planctopirus hydrillae TaxID=1841610 RepID=A0A1C3ETD8_9PLAN|nr:methyltransferase domain-containing protein [Planctopirus hydrillae]ODA36530.1 methyltransferase type 11 [Planctopirus hydrillae]